MAAVLPQPDVNKFDLAIWNCGLDSIAALGYNTPSPHAHHAHLRTRTARVTTRGLPIAAQAFNPAFFPLLRLIMPMVMLDVGLVDTIVILISLLPRLALVLLILLSVNTRSEARLSLAVRSEGGYEQSHQY
jgi:hypothetical protein